MGLAAITARHGLAVIAVLILTIAATMGGAAGSVIALAVIVVMGVPHGALDTERVRPILRPKAGRVWFLVYAVPYLGLAGLVLTGFKVAPEASLAVFLALSVFHFGTTDSGFARPIEAFARGGLPIALAVLAHPDATARVLSAAAGAPVGVPEWLFAVSVLWLPVGVFVFARAAQAQPNVAGEMAVLTAAFVALPPLVALAGYFVVLHAPRHLTELLAERSPRIRTRNEAWRRAMPTTVLTMLLGILAWPVTRGAADARLTLIVIQGLAALTVPHLMLELWLRYAGSNNPCSTATKAAPSPTAAAMRLVEPAPTSPIANTPGMLVAKASGWRHVLIQASLWNASPVRTKPR